DHKFDPIPTADYYSLAGIFFASHILPSPGAKTAGSAILRLPLASAAELARRKADQARIVELQKKIEQIADEQFAALAKESLSQTDRYLAAAWEYRNRTAAAPATPAPFAAERNLNPVVLGRWVDYLGPAGQGDVSAKLLTKGRHSVQGIAGLEAWNC